VHPEDLDTVLLVSVPLLNVGPMVVLKILHRSLLHTIELIVLSTNCDGY
jgi:hypothetical protein